VRILHVHQPTEGGVGRHVADLRDSLTRLGDEVITCGPAEPNGTSGGCRHVTLELGRAVHPAQDAVALRRYASIVREIRPDLVHAHSSKAGAIVRLGRAAHPRVPVVYTPHGYAFAGYFSRDAERMAYRTVERVLAPLASRVVCVCEAEARLARSIGPAGRVRVVYNGIDSAAPGRPDARMAELGVHGPVIGTLTQLRPGKGLETLLDATAQLVAREPRPQVAIWGAGPELAALERRAQARGVAGAVHFLGATSDPVSVLRGAEIFVLPSWAEAFPYVILEAMSAGRAIVASDVGGVHEALGDGEAGRLVPAGDAGALSAALLELLQHPDRRESLGAAAKRRLEQRFTTTQMVDGISNVYTEVVAS
jgi:glycosyltransferase involved in cell wall biosynthesis